MSKILFLTHHLPYPPTSGGRRREYELLKRISKRFDIHVCAVSKTFDEDCRNAKVLSEHCSCVNVKVFEAVDFKKLPASLLQKYPRQVLQNASNNASEYIASALTLETFDVIHVEGFYLMQHVPMESNIPVLLVEQNIEYLLWKQRAALASKEIHRLDYLRQYELTKIAERRAWLRSSLCAVLTKDDKKHIEKVLPSKNIRIVPDGLDHLTTVGALQPDATCIQQLSITEPSILFVGNFGYEPNVDAVLYFCQDIFPLIRSVVPEIKLFLVGDSPCPEVQALSDIPGVIVTGRVPSLAPYLKAVDVFVCPLRVGGGIKVKILEALYEGKAIVSTSIGGQGLPCGENSPLYIEDDTARFANQVVYLLQHPEERVRLKKTTAIFVNYLPSWNDATQMLMACYDELINNFSDSPAHHCKS
jgi:glycosyltransferase involved in cell wall biosynthesis